MQQPSEQIESFGAYLRREREMREIPLEEIAAYTRIKLKALQAIENDDLAALPPLAFVRAFIRCYADYIGLNLAEVMLRFDAFIQSRYPEMTGEIQLLPQRSRPRQRHLPVIFAVAFVLAVLFTYWYHRAPSGNQNSNTTPPDVEQPNPPPGGALPPTDVALAGTGGPATTPPAPANPEPATVPDSTAGQPGPEGRPASTRPPIQPRTRWTSRHEQPRGPPLRLATFPATDSDNGDLPPLPAVKHQLTIQAKDTCWIRYQVDYDSAHNAMLQVDKEFYGEAANRIRVQIGKPEAIEAITYNDQLFQFKCIAWPCCLAFPQQEEENCPDQ